jgi:hypothetical protein
MRKAWQVPLVVMVIIFFCIVPSAAIAGEGGTSMWIPGYRDLMSGFLPSPGTYLTNLVIVANLKDDQNTMAGKPRTNVSADIMTLTHVTKGKVFGGDYAISMRVPYFFNIDVQTGPSRAMGPRGKSQSNSGFSDLVLSPMILGWHSKKAHFMAVTNVYLPTGNYDSKNIANVSRKRWGLEQDLGVTYFPDKHWELSGFLGYTIPYENQVNQYLSGNELHFDFAAGYRFNKATTFGVAGYYLQQTTPDTGKAATFGSYDGQVTGLGPIFSYQTPDFNLKLKYTHDFTSQNRLNGEWYWLTTAFKF